MLKKLKDSKINNNQFVIGGICIILQFLIGFEYNESFPIMIGANLLLVIGICCIGDGIIKKLKDKKSNKL